MKQARRLDNAPPYLFVEIEENIKKALARGVDVINLGIGDPDLPTPYFVVRKMAEAIKNPNYHIYPEYDGCLEFRCAVAEHYKKRFGVDLDPETEVVALLGSKEGIAHIFFALVNEGDFTLVPDPEYPVYELATALTGGVPYHMPLTKENGFFPDLSAIPKEVIKRAKILFVNYPNNPTGAVANLEQYQKLVDFGLEHDIVVCNDNAYSEFTFDGIKAPSILNAVNAKDIAVEFHSFSKSYNMTGWRLGFAVGNREAISKLKKMKNNIDSGVFTAIQIAGIEALRGCEKFVEGMRKIYARRREIAINELQKLGFEFEIPKGTFYFWIKVPEGFTSKSFTDMLLEKTGVVVAPGSGYGEYGEGYIRISLTISDERLKEAFERIRKLGL
ncbi:LL-diaminopimelate aminotransferase [Acetivibrio clariflavus]|uniref:Aminotransferase n=1 Tax=Acetivibrio clariflavus (strain DSM 19732 / NBRC 101661 / EBR45) TaxID=720554 RepID=G8LZR9_ACECE|nr:LL-diaminopimelate aminotransferase [Acetivibrio clariflavus]AEV67970.1 aspartate/tyrosine/aromatic aminotransferase [Acetivibrio clariflavus DSM 19732]